METDSVSSSSSPPSTPSSTPHSFQFDILSDLGTGTFCEVYLVQDTTPWKDSKTQHVYSWLDRVDQLKNPQKLFVMKKCIFENDICLNAIHREIDVLLRIPKDQPNLAQTKAVFFCDKMVIIIQEFLPITLSDYQRAINEHVWKQTLNYEEDVENSEKELWGCISSPEKYCSLPYNSIHLHPFTTSSGFVPMFVKNNIPVYCMIPYYSVVKRSMTSLQETLRFMYQQHQTMYTILKKWKKSKTHPPTYFLRQQFCGFLRACRTLHSMGIYHNDIKPNNVGCRISHDGTTIDWVVYDLGNCLGTFRPYDYDSYGTVDYLPPEYFHSPLHQPLRLSLYGTETYSYAHLLGGLSTGQLEYFCRKVFCNGHESYFEQQDPNRGFCIQQLPLEPIWSGSCSIAEYIRLYMPSKLAEQLLGEKIPSEQKKYSVNTWFEQKKKYEAQGRSQRHQLELNERTYEYDPSIDYSKFRALRGHQLVKLENSLEQKRFEKHERRIHEILTERFTDEEKEYCKLDEMSDVEVSDSEDSYSREEEISCSEEESDYEDPEDDDEDEEMEEDKGEHNYSEDVHVLRSPSSSPEHIQMKTPTPSPPKRKRSCPSSAMKEDIKESQQNEAAEMFESLVPLVKRLESYKSKLEWICQWLRGMHPWDGSWAKDADRLLYVKRLKKDPKLWNAFEKMVQPDSFLRPTAAQLIAYLENEDPNTTLENTSHNYLHYLVNEEKWLYLRSCIDMYQTFAFSTPSTTSSPLCYFFPGELRNNLVERCFLEVDSQIKKGSSKTSSSQSYLSTFQHDIFSLGCFYFDTWLRWSHDTQWHVTHSYGEEDYYLVGLIAFLLAYSTIESRQYDTSWIQKEFFPETSNHQIRMLTHTMYIALKGNYYTPSLHNILSFLVQWVILSFTKQSTLQVFLDQIVSDQGQHLLHLSSLLLHQDVLLQYFIGKSSLDIMERMMAYIQLAYCLIAISPPETCFTSWTLATMHEHVKQYFSNKEGHANEWFNPSHFFLHSIPLRPEIYSLVKETWSRDQIQKHMETILLTNLLIKSEAKGAEQLLQFSFFSSLFDSSRSTIISIN